LTKSLAKNRIKNVKEVINFEKAYSISFRSVFSRICISILRLRKETGPETGPESSGSRNCASSASSDFCYSKSSR
jgi:hypothetical protein